MPPKRIDSHGATSRLQLPGEVEPPSARSTLYPGERWWPKSTVTTGDGRDFERRTGIVTSMHPDLDLGAQKSFLRGIRRMHERFPNVRLEVVEVERHAGGSKPWAFTHFRDPLPIDPDKRVASKIVLDAHTIDSDEHVGMVRAAARSQASAPFEKRGIVSVRTDKGDPYENAAMHEFGHALAKSDRVAVREECKRILREEFLSGVDRLPTQTYNDWMEARFPRYSRSSTDEMLAEAFADVEFNGRKRSDPIFQRIHDMMVDRYNMQANAMGLPEVPIIPGGKSTSIGKTAATPSPIETPTAIVDKAQTRRATRAAAQAEKAAARAAAQAEKAAARAAAQAEKEAAKVAKAAERATARRAKEARQEAAKRTRKATSAFNRQYNRLQTQRAAAAAREAKAAAAEADLRSLAGDIPPAGLSRREIARRVMASTPHVYTDKDAPPGPTTWVDMPSAEERAAALARRIPEMKRNRLQRYSEIPNHTKVAGRRWYPAEGTLGRNTAIDAGLDPIYGTGCGAAFSVRTDIKFNRGYQTQFFAMTAEQRAASANTDFTPTTMTSNLNRAKDVMAAPPTREGILAALQRNSPSPKLSNYFPSLEGDRTAHTADTWDGRVGDHSAIQIREVLGLPPGTRLTDKQEALGEKLLNVEEFGYHWKWIDKKGQWEPVPNYTAANKINDNYGAFKESSVQAAAETPKFPGRYESVFDPATGHYRVVLESTATVPWDPRDLQAALWIHIRNGSGS